MSATEDDHDHGRGPIDNAPIFPREAFPRDDAQGYVSARCDSRC